MYANKLNRLKVYLMNSMWLFSIFALFSFSMVNSSFSSTCEIDFSQVTFQAISGTVSYTSEQDNRIIINNNLSSHPLTLATSISTSEFDCYEISDIVIDVSGTITFANDFLIETIDEGLYTANWEFVIPDSRILTSSLQSFRFRSFSDSDNFEILTVGVDLESPSLSLNEVTRDGEPINIANPVLANRLKSGESIIFDFLLEDDISVNSFQIRSIQGGNLVENITESLSANTLNLFAQFNLTNSPLRFELVVFDQFGSTARENYEIKFDSLSPQLSSVEITAYDVDSNGRHSLLGELVIRDDFEIIEEDITMFSTIEGIDSTITYSITSCSFDEEQEDTLKFTICNFRSQPLEVDSSFTTNFSIRIYDIVGNELITNVIKNVEIQENGPQIHDFRLLNPVNNSNILSSLNSENSKIVLEYSNDLSSLYLSSNSNQNPQGVILQPNFNPFSNLESPVCEVIDSSINRQRCVWEVNPLQVQGLEQFNISIGVRNILGAVTFQEISIIVNDNVPDITNLRVVSRGNERILRPDGTYILQSYDRARIELFVENLDNNEEFDVRINGSVFIFRNSPDSISFRCDFYDESELGSNGHLCFSEDFELSVGFDGDRTEELRIIVTNRAGNSDLATKEIEILKIHEGESVDFYELELVELVTPLNRRVVQQQGMDVYHNFRLKPKADTGEFSIISVQILGMGTSEDSTDEDVRLNFFELQNQTSQGVVLGDNRNFFMKSFMPRLLSAYEMEGTTYSTIVISIVKRDIDTIYKDENITIRLPIEFYDMPRDLNSNIALVEKLLDDIESSSANSRSRQRLFEVYNMYRNICNTYSTISNAIQSLSRSWNIISLGLGSIAPGLTAPVDNIVGNTAKGDSMLKNMDGIMGKFCMLASCTFSQNLIGGALNSVSGDMRIGDYLTGQRSFLGNMVCRPE